MAPATPQTLITEDLAASIGRWSAPLVAPPIGLAEIRRWAIATWWPETPPRLHWDEDHARATRWRGIIAPPDFNPFAWPVDRPSLVAGREYGPGGIVLTAMNGGQVDSYGDPMRPGDVISSRTAVVEVTERQGRFGLMRFTVTSTRWTNQDGAFVRDRRSTGIHYPLRPEQA